MLVIKHHSYYRRCKTKYRWRSVDALLTLCWRSVDALLTLCWRSVDALLTLCWHSVDAHFQDVVGRVSMGVCTSRQLIRPKLTVTYRCQYFTIHSTISECDHKCETRNAEPEIGTDASSQTRWNPQVDGYGSGFGPPRVSGLGFWTCLERKQPVFAVQTRTSGWLPGPVANTNWNYLMKMSFNWIWTSFVVAQYVTLQWTALYCSWIEFIMVSLFIMWWYTTLQICVQCLTGLSVFLLIAQEAIVKNRHSPVRQCNLSLSHKSIYGACKFLLQCQI